MDDKKCYSCRHREGLPGSVHSCCKHPDVMQIQLDPLSQVMAIFASVGRAEPQISIQAISNKFEIKAHYTGIKKGWFNWPWNFDPVWLINCNAWELLENSKGE